MIQIAQPFQNFVDTSGAPLENGYVYIGTQNLNPETNPIAVYWDSALTIPAAQPIRTLNGYLSRNGSPGRLYANASIYSITVRDHNNVIVFTAIDASTLDNLRADIAATTGGALVGVNDRASGGDFTTLAGLVDRLQAPNNPTPVTIATPPGGYVQYGNSCAGGINALGAITGGTNNFAWGRNALIAATDASANIAIGNDALKTVTDGGNVIPASGTFAGQGWSNVAIGETVLRDMTTGYENVGIGTFTLQQLTTGCWNTALGPLSQITGTTASGNISVGAYTLTTNNGNNNVAIGWSACEVQAAGTNTVVGYVGMNANTTGSLNSVLGANALRLATTPDSNCVFGQGALENATATPSSNCVFGTYAMGSTTTAALTKCGAFGYESLLNVTGNFNNAFGSESFRALTSGTNNTGMGQSVGRYITTGANNVAVGYLALSTATGAATNNTAVGTNALLVATGDGNTALGSGALNGLTTETNCTGIGLTAAVTGSNQVQLGNASTTTYAYGAVQNRSDMRDKADIQDTALGLSFINALRPVDFKWDYREDYDWGPKDGSKKRGRYHHGLIAQEVKAACDAAGVDFGGYQDHKSNGGKDVMSLGYEELIGPLIKAVQEQQSMIVALSNRIAALEA